MSEMTVIHWEQRGFFSNNNADVDATILSLSECGARETEIRRSTVSNRGVSLLMRPQQLAVFPTGHYNKIVARPVRSAPSLQRSTAVVLPKERIAGVLNQEDRLPDLLLLRVGFNDPHLARVIRELDAARRCAKGATLIQSLEIRIVEILLQAEGRAPGTRGLVKFSPPVRRLVEDLIAQHLFEHIDLDRLSALAGLSPSRFLAVFRATFGTTPHQYLLGARVATAKQRLLSGEQGLSDLAAELGFASQSHFNSVFKSSTGTTLGEYRRIHHVRALVSAA